MEPVLASSLVGDYVTALLIASVPGVLVALLTQSLNVRHENAIERQTVANAQLLLSLEFEDNQQALAGFWTGLNALDKEGHPDDKDAHLQALVTSGLLNQTAPRWSSVRWWLGRYVDVRKDTFARLDTAVARAVAAKNPLKGAYR